ncbi:hypothetical protein MTR67_019697 [Solanum verrucosum]|uniref:Uncharacterized protein n=1 Tax=Solanum verrucosum TaxID=315347 RepID=A0AAF0QP75_SOLVR|nr:hypothetical protein MTR67_019697 [Solanum verrucosum]
MLERARRSDSSCQYHT